MNQTDVAHQLRGEMVAVFLYLGTAQSGGGGCTQDICGNVGSREWEEYTKAAGKVVTFRIFRPAFCLHFIFPKQTVLHGFAV